MELSTLGKMVGLKGWALFYTTNCKFAGLQILAFVLLI